MEMQALGLAGVAAVIAAVALIQRSETRLRLLVAVAALFAGTAAWLLGARGEGFVAAAASFGLIGLAGLIGYAMRRWELAPVSISRRHRHVLDAMGSLEPRLFRDLMKCAELRTADIPLRLTKEGRRPEKLWFVISGDVRISKLGQEARLKGPMFVAEISWLTAVRSTATVTLEPGAEFIEWDRDTLRRAAKGSPRIRTALEALVARDLARKVAAGQPPSADHSETGREAKLAV